MTTTQKAFNNIQTRINELTLLRPYTFGFAHEFNQINEFLTSLMNNADFNELVFNKIKK